MGGPERALTQRIPRTSGRPTTVLFARVSANEKPRIEAMSQRLRCVAAVAQAAELSGGRVVRKQGDAVMAVFASPDAATAAAARMHGYAEAAGQACANLRVRIGFQAGSVQQKGADVRGRVVDLALEFSSHAASGQIVTSEDTASLLTPRVQEAVRVLPSASANTGHSLREVLWRRAASQILAAQKEARTTRYKAIRLTYRGKTLVRRRQFDVVTMGRDAMLDFVIADKTVSRRHCEVMRRDTLFLVCDHSANGTFVMTEGEGEVHIHLDEFALTKSGWISLGQSGDATEEVVRYVCE